MRHRKLRRIFKKVTTRKAARRGARRTLRALHAEDCARRSAPSRWHAAEPEIDTPESGTRGEEDYVPAYYQKGYPAGVLPTTMHGRAVGSEPRDHMATSYSEVERATGGDFIYELPPEELDDDGTVMERPDLPTEVEEDGKMVAVERVGLKEEELSREPREESGNAERP